MTLLPDGFLARAQTSEFPLLITPERHAILTSVRTTINTLCFFDHNLISRLQISLLERLVWFLLCNVKFFKNLALIYANGLSNDRCITPSEPHLRHGIPAVAVQLFRTALPILSTNNPPRCLKPNLNSSYCTTALPSNSSSRLLLGTSCLFSALFSCLTCALCLLLFHLFSHCCGHHCFHL